MKSPASAPSNVLLAVGLMLAATVFLGFLDVCAKALGTRFPVTQLVWVRMAVHLLLAIIIFYPRSGRRLFRTSAWRLQLARSALLLTTGLLFFLALRYLPLAETAAITFSSPLLTVVLAGPVLGERLTRARLAIAVLGFCGVVAVIQPFTATLTPAVLLALAAAVTASLYALLTRSMRTDEDAATTWAYTAVAGAILLPLTIPFGWTMPDPVDGFLLIMLGIFGGFGHLAIIHAYRLATASLIAPLGYFELAWATVLALVLFAEFPNPLALVGMAIIAVSGVLIAGEHYRQEAGLRPGLRRGERGAS